jgi:hypothetical protein
VWRPENDRFIPHQEFKVTLYCDHSVTSADVRLVGVGIFKDQAGHVLAFLNGRLRITSAHASHRMIWHPESRSGDEAPQDSVTFCIWTERELQCWDCISSSKTGGESRDIRFRGRNWFPHSCT